MALMGCTYSYGNKTLQSCASKFLFGHFELYNKYIDIFCSCLHSYGHGPIYTQCAYVHLHIILMNHLYKLELHTHTHIQNATTGTNIPPKGNCLPTAVRDPFWAVQCPLTNVIHLNFESGICATIPRIANDVQVEVYVVDCSELNYCPFTNPSVFFFILNSHHCTGENNQRFIFNYEYGSFIQAAGTNLCFDIGLGGKLVPNLFYKL